MGAYVVHIYFNGQLVSVHVVRIVHLSYAVPHPTFSDPLKWLDRISFITGVFEKEAISNEVHAFYHISNSSTLLRNGVSYHFTNLKRWQLLFPRTFHNQLKGLRPDVVIVHGLIFPLQVLQLRFALGRKVTIILQHHAERPFHDARKYLQRWADRYISAYLFCAFDLGRLWYEQKQIGHREKIKEVMGTSSTFSPTDKRKARQMINLEDGKIYLWVGGLDKNKDPLTVIQAFSKFAKQHTDTKLYMIYQTDQLLETVKLLLERLQSSENIILVGKVSHQQLQYWYNSADFIVSSSHYEGSGIAVCEGLSCGCIPIVTNIPSFRMMTDNATIGYLYEPGDVEGLHRMFEASFKTQVDVEKQRVLNYFGRELSFEANAGKIWNVIKSVRQIIEG